MKKLLRFAVLLGGLLTAGDVFAAEVIQSFDSNVSVAKDGELTVIEALRVRAEGSAMRTASIAIFRSPFATPAARCAR